MNVEKNLKRGIFYTAIGKYSNVVIQLLVTAILSRILSPVEYGIVAVVNVFLLFFQMLADSGIGPAIVQNKELNKSDLISIFSLTIYSGIVLSCIFALLGYPMGVLYGETIYVSLFPLLGLCVLFYTITIVPQAILMKTMNFKIVNFLTIFSNIASGLVGVILAVSHFGVYSLIFSNIVRAMVLFIALYSKAKINFYWKVSKSSIGKIFEFSKFQFLFNFWNYFARNLDNLLIGRLISPSDLGYYDKAYQLSLYPNQILSQVVTPALHPIMSNFQDNISKIGEVYLQISRIFVIVGIPISAYLYFNAQYVVTFMFGDNWSQSVPVFQILAATIWLQMANSPTGAFYQATNQTRLLFRIGLLTSFINILAIVIGVMLQSIQCVAYMLLISFSLSLVINTLYLTKKVLNISAQKYIKLILINLTIISPYIVFNLFISDFVNDLILHLSVQFVILFLIWGIGMYISGEYRRVFAVIRK